jgi:hypothetical protein
MFRSLTAVMIAAACCQGCAAPRSAPKPTLPSAPAIDDTHMHTHSTAPLYLEVWARTHGSVAGPLFPDMTLRSGDRIGLGARTSCGADVYLLHCDRLDLLSVYPESGPVHFDADRRVSLPAPGMDLQLSNEPGYETLYIVASKHPLEQSDPALQAALLLQPSRPGHPGCGRALESALRGVRSKQARLSAAEHSVAVRGVELSSMQGTVTRALAGDDGIVVLRFPYRHVP